MLFTITAGEKRQVLHNSSSVGVLEAVSLASRRIEDSMICLWPWSTLGLEAQVLGLGLGLCVPDSNTAGGLGY